MPEWCFDYISCGSYSSLYLVDSHPLLEDGDVTRGIFGSRYNPMALLIKSRGVTPVSWPNSHHWPL